MKLGHRPVFSLLLLVLLSPNLAHSQQTPRPEPMSKQTKMDMIRAFTAELVYIRTNFPMGRNGLKLQDGKLSPHGKELDQMLAMFGPATKPGEQALITKILVKDKVIHFEINGGPIRKKKWYQRIEVGMGGGTAPIAPDDPNANPRGTFVDLVFDKYVPELNPQQLKDLLRPAFDFDAKSVEEAYLETVPPKVKEAIKNHAVLVGMNHEMVTYAKGRPPKKLREKEGDVEFEEWIYGDPPKDVDFVRFVGDEVVRVETMKVGGEKLVRTEKEVDLGAQQPSLAKGSEEPAIPKAGAPTLRRPGEEADPNTRTDPTPKRPRPAPSSGDPDPNATPTPMFGFIGNL